MDLSFYKSEVDDVPADKITAYDQINVVDIDGNEKKLSDVVKGQKAVLIVNVASACGFTDSGYKGLVELYNKYHEKGLEVLGFPCNQFMNQEDKCELDIKNFGKEKYNVTFPMFSKVEVNGPNAHQLYNYLKTNSKEHNQGNGKVKNIPWNFSKFLVNHEGKVVASYPPNVKTEEIIPDIEKLL